MSRICVSVKQANADGPNFLPREKLRRLANARLVQRAHHGPSMIEPFGDLPDERQRHDPIRLDPEIRIAVALRDALPCDFQHVTKARRDDQAQRAEAVFQHRVGGDRGSVTERGYVRRLRAHYFADRRHPLNQRMGRMVGRARHLGGGDGSARAIKRDDVGERTAGVDADPKAAHIENIDHGASSGSALADLKDQFPTKMARLADCVSCRRFRQGIDGDFRDPYDTRCHQIDDAFEMQAVAAHPWPQRLHILARWLRRRGT